MAEGKRPVFLVVEAWPAAREYAVDLLRDRGVVYAPENPSELDRCLEALLANNVTIDVVLLGGELWLEEDNPLHLFPPILLFRFLSQWNTWVCWREAIDRVLSEDSLLVLTDQDECRRATQKQFFESCRCVDLPFPASTSQLRCIQPALAAVLEEYAG